MQNTSDRSTVIILFICLAFVFLLVTGIIRVLNSLMAINRSSDRVRVKRAMASLFSFGVTPLFMSAEAHSKVLDVSLDDVKIIRQFAFFELIEDALFAALLMYVWVPLMGMLQD